MPKCKKCCGYFPTRFTIDGKQTNSMRRKYCLQCSPFGSRNTKKENFLVEGGNKDDIRVCQSCLREYTFVPKSGHTKIRCNSCKVNDRKHATKARNVKYKGGKCEACGYSKSQRALAFHHVFPEKKSFDLAGAYCRKWETIKEELDKTILLCHNCHDECHEFMTITGSGTQDFLNYPAWKL